jgi:uncharacterized protein
MLTLAAWGLAALCWSLVANLVLGDVAYVPRNLAFTALLLLVARRLALSPEELGTTRSGVRRGLRWGAGAVGIIGAVLVAAALLAEAVPPIGVLLDDERAELEGGALAYAVLVRIPLGTVVFEEVLFRGVLLALFLRRTGRTAAVVGCSVVFGVWHVAPTIVALQLNDVPPGSAAGLAAIAGAVVVTTVAGVLFSWLRLRSSSLVAPMLAHWATNALGLLAAVAV